ncbi:MAG: hypothetical protein Q7J26_16010 [Brevundimonas sp.]|uniref:hypothetical protein n=1 Tax=Brevundimonas sp. TaxID=1871086 RepID=UPI00271F3AB1|nr:hypothetical protein [Brevundimonas sp.]MDO9610028.1 hypothetical protein [Brevundimonas sp.]
MTPIPLPFRTILPFVALSCVLSSAGAASAQDSKPSHTNDLLSAISHCRQIQQGAARLACFDAAAAAIGDAGEVAIVSRADVTRNQRSLFGFNVETLNPFSGNGRQPDLQSISATLTSVRDLGRGVWLLTLDDGSIWRVTDSVEPTFSTRRQYPVTVRRAAMGSYLMKVGNFPPFRVRRE